MPIILLWLQSWVVNGFHQGIKAYRSGMFIAGFTLVAGVGLQAQTDMELQIPGLWLAVVAAIISVYTCFLLKRNVANQADLFQLGH